LRAIAAEVHAHSNSVHQVERTFEEGGFEPIRFFALYSKPVRVNATEETFKTYLQESIKVFGFRDLLDVPSP